LINKTFRAGVSKGQGNSGKQEEDDDDDDEEGHGGEDKLADFKKGISEYILTKFYVKKKKEA